MNKEDDSVIHTNMDSDLKIEESNIESSLFERAVKWLQENIRPNKDLYYSIKNGK